MLLGIWSRKMHNNAMPRQPSIRRYRPSPFSCGSSSTYGLGVAIRSCTWLPQSSNMDLPCAAPRSFVDAVVGRPNFSDLALRARPRHLGHREPVAISSCITLLGDL